MYCCRSVTLHYVMLRYDMLCDATLCYVMLHYAILCYVSLCYVMLGYLSAFHLVRSLSSWRVLLFLHRQSFIRLHSLPSVSTQRDVRVVFEEASTERRCPVRVTLFRASGRRQRGAGGK